MINTAHQQPPLRGVERDGEAEPALSAEAEAVLSRLDEASPLADQLQALSKEIGLRDRELMDLAGISRATLARWRKHGDGDRPRALDE